MSPRRQTVDPSQGVLHVEWPLFGELSRALALKVSREYDPEIVVGVATAGVVPGAVVAAILDRQFAAITVSRRFRGDTLRLAVGAIVNAGAAMVRTAVGFRTGSYEPDFHALATESTIVLPWDRELIVDGELTANPLYADALDQP